MSDTVGHLQGSNTVLSGKIPDTAIPIDIPTGATTSSFTINISRSKPRLQKYDDDTETVVQQTAKYSPPSVRSSKFKTDIPPRERKYHRLACDCEETSDSKMTGNVKTEYKDKPALPSANIKLPSPFLRSASQPVFTKTSELSTSPKRMPLFDLLGVKTTQLTSKPQQTHDVPQSQQTHDTSQPQQMPRASQQPSGHKGGNPGSDHGVIPETLERLHQQSVTNTEEFRASYASAPCSPEVTPQSSPKAQRKGFIGWLLGDEHKERPVTSPVSPAKASRGLFDSFFHTNNDGSCVDGATSKQTDYPLPSRQEFFHQKEDHQFLQKPSTVNPSQVNTIDTSYLTGKVLVNDSDLNAFAPQNM